MQSIPLLCYQLKNTNNVNITLVNNLMIYIQIKWLQSTTIISFHMFYMPTNLLQCLGLLSPYKTHFVVGFCRHLLTYFTGIIYLSFTCRPTQLSVYQYRSSWSRGATIIIIIVIIIIWFAMCVWRTVWSYSVIMTFWSCTAIYCEQTNK